MSKITTPLNIALWVYNTMNVCEYCDKVFKRKYNLIRHQKTAVYCLEKRREQLDTEHDNSSSDDRVGVLEKVIDLIKELQQQNNNVMKNMQQQNNNTLKNIQEQNNNMQQHNRDIIKKMFDMIDNRDNSTKNSNLAIKELLPITDDDLAAYLDNLSLEFIIRGVQGYADYAGSYPFKGRVICTDRSRRKLQYKNEDGIITSDGRALAQRFFQAIEKKNTAIINNEYNKLQHQLQEIIDTNNTSDEAVSNILKQATFIQDMLIKIQNAAQGKDEEFTQLFLLHLSKKV